jgi:hypothetical protein
MVMLILSLLAELVRVVIQMMAALIVLLLAIHRRMSCRRRR